ncbi:MAG: nucleoside/nucleotide kinase family protein [Actinomyces ruminicola]|nr:nucleoside/nucleotide kinase family protein [Actinomyces ruminicola]
MRLVVNGLEQEIQEDSHGVSMLLEPALVAWMRRPLAARRSFAFLAAPPGTGKSTLAAILAQRLAPDLQCVGMDGFHLPQAELDRRTIVRDGRTIPLASIKGAPESFGLEELDRALTRAHREDIVWPRYDRVLHDVVADGEALTAPHVLVEGNWLLLDEPGWRDLRRHADLTVFIAAPEELLARRLIARKVQGGLSTDAARSFYERSDGPNIQRVLNHSFRNGTDLVLTMDRDGLLHESDHA